MKETIVRVKKKIRSVITRLSTSLKVSKQYKSIKWKIRKQRERTRRGTIEPSLCVDVGKFFHLTRTPPLVEYCYREPTGLVRFSYTTDQTTLSGPSGFPMSPSKFDRIPIRISNVCLPSTSIFVYKSKSFVVCVVVRGFPSQSITSPPLNSSHRPKP